MNEYEIETTTKAPKKILQLIFTLVAVALLVMTVYYLTKVNQAASSESRAVSFVIEKGTNSKQVGAKLETSGVIRNNWVFLVYIKLHNADDKIQAGEYALDANMSITEIVDILTHGRVVSSARTITTIEGWTNAQISSYLAARQIVTKPVEFADILQRSQFDFKFIEDAKSFNYQGFLFPDTYQIGKNDGAGSLAQKMLSNFENKFTDQMLSDTKAAGRSLKDIIILASIIEKEVGRNKETITQAEKEIMQQERELAASVFYNRLAVGHALEADATINYIFGHTGGIPTLDQVKTQSPYNTYLNPGLPPGPIANPGLGSIMAAIYPAQSGYFYFINKSDGEAVFAQTLAEHNVNKAKYLNLK